VQDFCESHAYRVIVRLNLNRTLRFQGRSRQSIIRIQFLTGFDLRRVAARQQQTQGDASSSDE
jgi:hypothetical protein